jgi:hypothetical protein
MRRLRATLPAIAILFATCQSPTAETFEVVASVSADASIDIANTTARDWQSVSVAACDDAGSPTALGSLARFHSVLVHVQAGCYDVRRTFDGGAATHRIEVAAGERYVFRITTVRVGFGQP